LPTPLFESLGAFLITALLLSLGRRELPTGMRFFLYLALSGLARFIVEYVRRNPDFIAGLTQAQVAGILFTLAGLVGMFLSLRRWKKA
jgi:phosphatidylglycerol:prolipoprotein diacylglycerol transferase